ncbi:YesK family protein [Sporosarcina trichiuri]|uniref:YesK family protein n=1 Tax=Sporosarcina trichiuri TaxID=3056445 RepID=UPI0025B33BC6|nr:YesK family protein [Sporosarcina sp. 0.2-SM1T-5]WJY27313.1 YesK family protein [Sporosarcina sp. 0.2-SM1T-5]
MEALMLAGWTPILLAGIVAMGLVIALSRKLSRPLFFKITLGIAVLCVSAFFISMIVIGGWEGMGYSFLAGAALLGTIVGMAVGAASDRSGS